MLLENKSAVIYGAEERSAVQSPMPLREGARLFLSSRHLTGVENAANEIAAAAEWLRPRKWMPSMSKEWISTSAWSSKKVEAFISFNAIGISNTRSDGSPLPGCEMRRFWGRP